MKVLLYAVIPTAAITIALLNIEIVPVPCKAPALEVVCSGFYCEPVGRKELPEICSPLYKDGTGRWAVCMGVGPK